MDKEILEKIDDIEREIAVLPQGSITKKTIKGKDYFYHRVSQDGKRVENYIRFEELSALQEGIFKRKALEKELRKLRSSAPHNAIPVNKELNFKTKVRLTNNSNHRFHP